MRLVPLLLLAACMNTPWSGMTTDGTIPVAGMADISGARIEMYAFDNVDGKYVEVGETTAAWKPFIERGALCENSPPLHPFTMTVTLDQPQYWVQDSKGVYQARVRATEFSPTSTYEQAILFTDQEFGFNCIEEHLEPGCNFYDVAMACGYELTDAVVNNSAM